MSDKKVWFVTGCSRGLGQALVKKLLEKNYSVAATSRSKENLLECEARSYFQRQQSRRI